LIIITANTYLDVNTEIENLKNAVVNVCITALSRSL